MEPIGRCLAQVSVSPENGIWAVCLSQQTMTWSEREAFLSGGQWNGSNYYFESATGIQKTNPLILVNDTGFGVRSNTFGFNIRAPGWTGSYYRIFNRPVTLATAIDHHTPNRFVLLLSTV